MKKNHRRATLLCGTVIAATSLVSAPQADAATVITPGGGFASVISNLLGGFSAPIAPPKVTPTPPPAPAANPETQEEVKLVSLVEDQLGTPYVYGGSQPGGFDCSGLVSWAYAQVGKTIPRVSNDQLSSGQHVSLDALKPGDIVGYDGGGHVGMYVGNGDVIHAPQTGDVVKRVPVNAAGNAYTAVRF